MSCVIQAFGFIFGRHPESDEGLHDFDDDEGEDASPGRRPAALLGPVFARALTFDVRLFCLHTVIKCRGARCMPLTFAISRGARARGENHEKARRKER